MKKKQMEFKLWAIVASGDTNTPPLDISWCKEVIEARHQENKIRFKPAFEYEKNWKLVPCVVTYKLPN